MSGRAEATTIAPHQALAMACPVERYRHSPRPCDGLPEFDYPFHDKAVTVTNLSRVFAGQTVGIKQTDDHIWLVSFMD
ncbi:putative transposase [Pseudorhizobium tarimense]|uniref:Transposase n=1 Tax=Pseudorhizobium tarimense TaxID=1079109 RepID=A0ABV2H6C3_9HYPH|nr:hypothetical protein [Pseudorhizobium tarimense]MCJ8519081.1 hypothetical protein [Pseudorhizobium tarimense]